MFVITGVEFYYSFFFPNTYKHLLLGNLYDCMVAGKVGLSEGLGYLLVFGSHWICFFKVQTGS